MRTFMAGVVSVAFAAPTRSRRFSISHLATFFLFVTLATSAHSQPIPMGQPTANTRYHAAKELGFSNGSFIVAPIPFENPSLGTGLALGGAYLFQRDDDSSPSSLGFGAFRTSNSSQGYGLSLNLYLGTSNWRTTFLAANADLIYDLYVLGAPIPMKQSATGFNAEFLYDKTPQLSVGFGLSYADTTVGLSQGSDGTLPPSVIADADLSIAKISLLADWDRRDDTYYPTTGSLISGNLSYGEVTNVGARGYFKAVFSAAGYMPLIAEGVLSGRITACQAGGDAPFFDACALGPVDGFRGYSATEFLDNGLMSIQAEYRGRFSERFGFVVFAGSGAVGSDFGAALGGSFQTAAGVGARIRLSKSVPLDYAIDYSINDNDETLLYVSVGQRF